MSIRQSSMLASGEYARLVKQCDASKPADDAIQRSLRPLHPEHFSRQLERRRFTDEVLGVQLPGEAPCEDRARCEALFRDVFDEVAWEPRTRASCAHTIRDGSARS